MTSLSKKLLFLVGMVGGTSTLGYLLKEKIGSLAAYLVESFEEHIYQNITSYPSYTSVVPKNESMRIFSYWMEKLHPIDVKLGSDIAVCTFLLLGIPSFAALLGYLISKKLGD